MAITLVTGVTSWMMRVQNQTPIKEDFTPEDLSNLFMPGKGRNAIRPQSLPSCTESIKLEKLVSPIRRSFSDRSPCKTLSRASSDAGKCDVARIV